MRDAVSLLDQCMAGEEHIVWDVVRIAGVVEDERISQMADSICVKRRKLLNIIDAAVADGKDITGFCPTLSFITGICLYAAFQAAQQACGNRRNGCGDLRHKPENMERIE